MQNDMQTMFLEHQALVAYLISFSLWYFMQPSNSQINIKSNPGLHQFCFTSSCDWFRKLMPLSQPIRCKTEMGLKPITNCSSCVFSPFLHLGCCCCCYFCSHWLLSYYPSCCGYFGFGFKTFNQKLLLSDYKQLHIIKFFII